MEKALSLAADVGGDLLDPLGELGIGLHLLFHLVQGVEDGGVVTVAELLADAVQRRGVHPPDEIHGDRKSTRLNSSHASKSRMPSSA